MILFLIPVDSLNDGKYTVLINSNYEFKEGNFLLVSWNEIKIEMDTSVKISVSNVDDLEKAVFAVAEQDNVCKDINLQFKSQYATDIFEQRRQTSDNIIKNIIKNIFQSWAHPMIGNLMVSPRIRPMTANAQYVKNWEAFPNEYMTPQTKAAIRAIMDDLKGVGLTELKKSGRDQLRVCKDMTDLARAIMGEISTYPTKKLEKIFALGLCKSEILKEAQKELLHKAIDCLDKEKRINQSCAACEYLRFYFPGFFVKDKQTNKDYSWTLFVQLMTEYIGENELVCDPFPGCKEDEREKAIEKFRRFPPTIRGAILINDFRKIYADFITPKGKEGESKTIQRYSLATINIIGGHQSDLKYNLQCKIVEAPSSEFIPEIYTTIEGEKRKKHYIWNRTRDEQHVATHTYRHFLLPLWGGPSGHTAGLIHVYKTLIKQDNIEVRIEEKNVQIPLSSIIIGSMFPFWRLYYDKRISAVHTMAETIEGSYAAIKGRYDEEAESVFLQAETAGIELTDKLDENADPFELLRLRYEKKDSEYISIENREGIIHPARVMRQLKSTYYPSGEKTLKDGEKELDDFINAKKTELTKENWEVPEWSKPIEEDKEDTQSYDDLIKKINISSVCSFDLLNVRTFKLVPKQRLRGYRTALLEKLYQKISALECYNFSQDFQFLPQWWIGTELKPLLQEITFYDIQACGWDGDWLTFAAGVDTQSEVWDGVRAYLPLDGRHPVACTVMDGEDGPLASVCMAVSGEWQPIGGIKVSFYQAVVESGLDGRNLLPSCYLKGKIAAGQDELELMVNFRVGSLPVKLYGCYEGGKVLSISRLLALFGLDGLLDVSALLPDEESTFGSLGLQDFSLEMIPDSGVVTELFFTITAEKAWQLWKDKITLQPYFEISIDFPFDAEARSISYDVLGKWHLGETEFDLMYRSYGQLQLKLAEDSVLDFSEVARLFAPDIRFPSIKLVDMEMTAVPARGDYTLNLYAEDLLQFAIGTTSLAIEGVGVRLKFYDGAFDEVMLMGELTLAQLGLVLVGSYGQDGQWSFDASAFNDTDYSLGDFVRELSGQLGGGEASSDLPTDFLTVNLRGISVSYQSEKNVLSGFIQLEKVLKISDQFSLDSFSASITLSEDEPLSFQIVGVVQLCGTEISLTLEKEDDEYCIRGAADFGGATLGQLAQELGLSSEQIPEFIAQAEIPGIGMEYNLSSRKFTVTVASGMGEISLGITPGEETEWEICLKTSSAYSVDLYQLPVAGEMARKAMPKTPDCSIGTFALTWKSNHTVVMECLAFGQLEQFQFDTQLAQADLCLPGTIESRAIKTTDNAIVKWLPVNKTFAVVRIDKLGFGLDGSRIMILLDAGMNLSPLAFGLTGAGAGVDLMRPRDVAFYLSGFGISFESEGVSIGGSFSLTQKKGKPCYAGALLIKCKAFSAEAVAEYGDGALMAYCVIGGGVIGPPAFTVRGLALGFGYNKQLLLPDICQVSNYPLIAAASGGFSPQILADFDHYILNQSGQYFLAAGIKFTSFEMIHGFILASVSFGRSLELGLLGLGEVSVPPGVSANPLAWAQLAVKADYNAGKGVFSTEARLTSESYILCRDCRLSGGFAAYGWFEGSEHEGEFVVTLGGYHPAFNKPDYYPVVPRVGFNWNVTKNLNISGEAYFALTPSAVMAGGRLSAVYSVGKLKAWFIAYADFLIFWRPFAYRAEIGVSLGASYRVDAWLVHKTFSIEMSAKLALWGPEIHGKLHISWFIISFTISFSTGPDRSEKALSWREFKQGFLSETVSTEKNESQNNLVLNIVVEGVTGSTADGTAVVDPNRLKITLLSKVPENGNVRPMNGSSLKSILELHVETGDHINADDRFETRKMTQNLPAALWKSPSDNPLDEEPLVQGAVCGLVLHVKDCQLPELFPSTRPISLEELFKKNVLDFADCFSYQTVEEIVLSDQDTLRRFSEHAMSAETCQRRKAFLHDHGIDEDIQIDQFAQEADSWLAEEILFADAAQ